MTRSKSTTTSAPIWSGLAPSEPIAETSADDDEYSQKPRPYRIPLVYLPSFHVMVQSVRPWTVSVGYSVEDTRRNAAQTSDHCTLPMVSLCLSETLAPWAKAEIPAGDDFDTNYYDDMFYDDDTEETQDDEADSDRNAGRNLSCTGTLLLLAQVHYCY